jgi:hypothetical protein
MEKLIELVKALHPKRVTYVDILSNNLSDESKLKLLYDGLRSGKIVDNPSGIDYLYPDDPDGKSKFAKLKSYFKKRLLNNALLAEAKEGERKKAFFDCLRTFVTAYFLIMLQGRSNGIQILRAKLKKMQRYEFTFLTLESAKILRQHYGVIVGDLKTAKLYDRIIESHLNLYVVETRIEGFYHELMSYYVRSRASTADLVALCDSYIARMPAAIPDNSSTSLIFKYYMILIVRRMSAHQFDVAKEVCATGIEQLRQKTFQDRTALVAIYFQWMTCQLNLREFEACKLLLPTTMSYLSTGEFNWFKGMLIKIDSSLATRDYQTAYDTYERVTKEKNFQKINIASQEEWIIYGVYIHLLKTFRLVASASILKQELIDPSTVLNELSIFNRDKEGLNVAIIIYSMILLIHQGAYNEVLEKSDGILKYVKRHLQGDQHERSVLFIKILIYICKLKYGQSSASYKIEKYLAELNASTAHSHLVTSNLEIIPYNDLWQILEKYLKGKHWFTIYAG